MQPPHSSVDPLGSAQRAAMLAHYRRVVPRAAPARRRNAAHRRTLPARPRSRTHVPRIPTRRSAAHDACRRRPHATRLHALSRLQRKRRPLGDPPRRLRAPLLDAHRARPNPRPLRPHHPRPHPHPPYSKWPSVTPSAGSQSEPEFEGQPPPCQTPRNAGASVPPA